MDIMQDRKDSRTAYINVPPAPLNENETISYNEVPQAIAWIIKKLSRLDEKFDKALGQKIAKGEDRWMHAKDLSVYLPNHPAVQTIYNWTATRSIPFHRKGKYIVFLKSEIDEWLFGEYQSTDKQLTEKALAFLLQKKH